MFFFLSFVFCCSIHLQGCRIKRFLNAEVRNRIEVSQKSHDAHREEIAFTRKLLFGGATLIGFVVTILIILALYLFRKLRFLMRSRQITPLTAIEAAGLA